MYHSFEELAVWQRSCALAVQLYALLHESRDFGLRDQMQRAAVSIASNIAEGHERSGHDYARFVTIALGSAAELRTQCYIAMKIGELAQDEGTKLVEELKAIARMLNALRRAIRPPQKPSSKEARSHKPESRIPNFET